MVSSPNQPFERLSKWLRIADKPEFDVGIPGPIRVDPPLKIRVLNDVLEEYALQVWTRFSLMRSAAAARTAGGPIDAHLVFGAILAEANLPADTDSAAFLLRWLWEHERPEDALPDARRAATELLDLPDLGPAPAVASTGRLPLRTEDQDRLREILDAARGCCLRTAPRESDIDTRHMLAVLLRRTEVQEVLERKGVRIADLRRDLYDFIVRSHPRDVAIEWRRVLLGAGFEMRTFISRDTWTVDDVLGYRLYAQAISESILDETTQPPLTIGIQAPWGQGKTSLMRMIQKRLDPDAAARDETHPDLLLDLSETARTTYRDLLKWIREWLASDAKSSASNRNGMLNVTPDRVPTVWFNPLYYRESAQVWAGMAHAILHQLARQLSIGDREKFWLHLQIARINPAMVRREIHQQIMMRMVPLGLLACLSVFLLASGDIGLRLLNSLWGLAGGGLVGLIWGKAKTIDARFEKYVNEPDYQSHLGLLHLVDQDLDVALRLLVGSRPIAVFIDDLDRCDPQTVNQVVLAINQFLSLPRRNVFFFLGMDMEMVAAALEQAQKETLAAVAGAQRRSYGWRFMEKFVQLPFVIPHLDKSLAKAFATGYLRGNAELDDNRTTEFIERVKQVRYAEEVGTIAKDALSHDLTPHDRASLQQAFSKRARELMRDPESDEIERIIALAIEDLELNPRTMKRYFALVRLLRNVQLASGTIQEPDHDRRLVLRTAHLLLNWPQFVHWIRNAVTETPERHPLLAMLEAVVKQKGGHDRWCKEIKTVIGGELPPHLREISLYRFISKITSDPPGLTAMYDARLF